jgi:hypothetical protein
MAAPTNKHGCRNEGEQRDVAEETPFEGRMAVSTTRSCGHATQNYAYGTQFQEIKE